MKNIEIIDLRRVNGVHVLSFPPHCTHKLQPLDVGFMKPFSTYYTEAANNSLRLNAGKVITQFQIAQLVDKAFEKAATLSTAYNAFRATGIWPLNPDVFTEADFLAAVTTDIDTVPKENFSRCRKAKGKLALFITEHSSISTIDHLADLCKDI